jgi:hypothetical protein
MGKAIVLSRKESEDGTARERTPPPPVIPAGAIFKPVSEKRGCGETAIGGDGADKTGAETTRAETAESGGGCEETDGGRETTGVATAGTPETGTILAGAGGRETDGALKESIN